jgi:hypothetical protein
VRCPHRAGLQDRIIGFRWADIVAEPGIDDDGVGDLGRKVDPFKGNDGFQLVWLTFGITELLVGDLLMKIPGRETSGVHHAAYI